MTTYVLRDGALVEKHLANPLPEHRVAFSLIRDGMDPTLHMANGRLYDSKSEFRKATKAAGCIEVGDQKDYGQRRSAIKLDKRQRVDDVRRAVYELKNGRRA